MRALKYISPFEEDASVIANIESRLFHSEASVVCSALEDLLYYKLGKGSPEKANFSLLLDQSQLAKTIGTSRMYSANMKLTHLGPRVHHRFLTGLYSRLATSAQGRIMQGHLNLLHRLEGYASSQPALTFVCLVFK